MRPGESGLGAPRLNPTFCIPGSGVTVSVTPRDTKAERVGLVWLGGGVLENLHPIAKLKLSRGELSPCCQSGTPIPSAGKSPREWGGWGVSISGARGGRAELTSRLSSPPSKSGSSRRLRHSGGGGEGGGDARVGGGPLPARPSSKLCSLWSLARRRPESFLPEFTFSPSMPDA